MDMTAASVYGTAPTFIGTTPAQTAISATDDHPSGWKGLASPNNPLFWAFGLLLITVGAAGLAGSVKLGPAKLAGSVGST
jgi:hypothetical protein